VWRHHFGNMTDAGGTFEVDRPRLWEALERVPGPVMLVRGGASPVVSDEDVDELRRRRPDATVHVIDGLGHDVPGEAPLVLAGFLEEFLAGLDDGGEG
jgi:pimeloyl-ACP methyl ester carboxylesterase